jgi:hypothetical protein
MLDFLSNNIPKALLPMTVVVVGFAIIASSLYITKLIMMIEKRWQRRKPQENTVDDSSANDPEAAMPPTRPETGLENPSDSHEDASMIHEEEINQDE